MGGGGCERGGRLASEPMAGFLRVEGDVRPCVVRGAEGRVEGGGYMTA